MEEYHLKALYPSPNATIRAALDGTVFRKPIQTPVLQGAVRTWKEPIAIGRHAYGDVYKAAEMAIPGPGKVELVYTPADGGEAKKLLVQDMNGPGVVQAMHNYDESIRNFARACFLYALSEHINVWFASKDTISKTYDGRFRDIFNKVYEDEFKDKCRDAGITYFYTLIDDAVARVMQSEGGFLWACKNYDGDVMSDMLASACGSLAMMTSVLVSPENSEHPVCYEYEAAHGTVQKHWYRYQKGEKTSTNPVALIFAWSGALAKRGELDGDDALVTFAKKLEAETLAAIFEGKMTGDLAKRAEHYVKPLNSWEFIDEIARRL
jgi:isocitrate dehydrogenase